MSTSEPTNAPSLPSTADATPYVPVSWMAVAAAVVAGTYVSCLLVFGYFAFVGKKPLLMVELLVLPAVALVLCFAARRMIRNSEGTRTGDNLVNAAWWTSVILGLCYVAYLFAIGFAIRRDARGEVDKWMAQIKSGTDEDIGKAFHRTLAPGQRQSVAATDLDGMKTAFRDELLAFSTGDLVRLAQRNRDQFKFEIEGVTWENRPGVVECRVTGTATCPEGTFPVLLPLRGLEGVTKSDAPGAAPAAAAAGRQWMIVRPPQGGFIDQARATRTGFGWLVAILESDGGLAGKAFLDYQGAGPVGREYAHQVFVSAGGDRTGFNTQTVAGLLRNSFGWWDGAAARLMLRLGDAGYTDFVDNRFFKTTTGAEPSARDKRRFLEAWNGPGLRPAGDKLRDQAGNVPDKENVITFTGDAVEVRVPVEIPLLPQRADGDLPVNPEDQRPGTARGRLVLTCADPHLLALVKRYRESANPATGTTDIPAELRAELDRYKNAKDPNRLALPWRVVRIESDLKSVVVLQQGKGGPPGGGMPGGGGGHGAAGH